MQHTKKANAQTAHLIFANTKANALKTKRAVSSQRNKRTTMIKLPNIGLTFTDGDEWEDFCQRCLKIKHQHQNIKPVPGDSGGDYGLDGFNTNGDAYQCYCPEKEYTDKELYGHQRDKITSDIQKLYDYKDKLRTILNGCKIKTWHFTTPLIKSKELILHCNTKESLVKSWKLDFIDDCEHQKQEDAERVITQAKLKAGLAVDEQVTVLTDIGPYYIAHEFDTYLKEIGIKHIRGRALYPQTQGKIERYHEP